MRTLLSGLILISVSLLAQDADLSNIKTIDAKTPKDIQIKLALSAGPPVADKAAVYVIGPKGYELARKGTNGFTCLVSRQEPGTMEPECFDAEGTATTLKARFYVEELRAQGVAEEEIAKRVEAGYKSKRFIAPRKPGIVYMMSPYNYVLNPEDNKILHFPGHLMFHAPYLTKEQVGEGKGAPYLTNPGKPDNLMVVVPASN
jgi:hypothetical protein